MLTPMPQMKTAPSKHEEAQELTQSCVCSTQSSKAHPQEGPQSETRSEVPIRTAAKHQSNRPQTVETPVTRHPTQAKRTAPQPAYAYRLANPERAEAGETSTHTM